MTNKKMHENEKTENNEIEDISSISKCISLIRLYLGYNKIKDISPLSNCALVAFLDLGHNKIEDISALSNCISLTRISLNSNKIGDVSALLLKCTLLDYIDLRNTNISNRPVLDRVISIYY